MVYTDFRHELKFIVNEAQLEQIKYRISALMHKDKNQSGDYYTITSVYFDDFADSFLQENFDGVDPRSKYRIRIYNNSFDYIRLEKKSKLHGMTRKESAVLTKSECEAILSKSFQNCKFEAAPKKHLLLSEMKMMGLVPKSIVEYDRTAFVNPIGNVRITFDKNIRGSCKTNDFLNPKILTVPLMQSGTHILEVKYDELLPEYIYDSLEIDTLAQTAFSKYVYSRKYQY